MAASKRICCYRCVTALVGDDGDSLCKKKGEFIRNVDDQCTYFVCDESLDMVHMSCATGTSVPPDYISSSGLNPCTTQGHDVCGMCRVCRCVICCVWYVPCVLCAMCGWCWVLQRGLAILRACFVWGYRPW